MQVRQLSVPHAWEFTPRTFGDDRGEFLEWFKADELCAAVGHPFQLAQANHSLSRRGVLRGIHYAKVPPGQAKYVYCPQGSVLDVIIDIRLGSPTFGRWDAVRLDATDRRAVYIGEGLGHAFMALTDDSSVTYLCSTPYNPSTEFTIDPLDGSLGLPWPNELAPLLSDRDREALSLAEAQAAGMLPVYGECVAFYDSLRE
jgi:dTDP-4-dehydrorhamnose 3,5-epimerase